MYHFKVNSGLSKNEAEVGSVPVAVPKEARMLEYSSALHLMELPPPAAALSVSVAPALTW